MVCVYKAHSHIDVILVLTSIQSRAHCTGIHHIDDANARVQRVCQAVLGRCNLRTTTQDCTPPKILSLQTIYERTSRDTVFGIVDAERTTLETHELGKSSKNKEYTSMHYSLPQKKMTLSVALLSSDAAASSVAICQQHMDAPVVNHSGNNHTHMEELVAVECQVELPGTPAFWHSQRK